MTTETKGTDTTEATTAPGTPAGVAVDQAGAPPGLPRDQAGAAAPAVDQAAAGNTAPAGETPLPGTLGALTRDSELVQFLRSIRDGLDELRRLMAELRADIDEIGGTVTGHAGVIDAQSRSMDAMQEAIGILGTRLPQPNVRAEPVRTLPPGGALPGGVVLPPLQPAPSLPPGVLPPLQPARSLTAVPTNLRHVQISRPATQAPGVELAIDVNGLPPGQHLIPASPETGGVDIELNVRRPEGMGGIAAPRNPKPAYRRQR